MDERQHILSKLDGLEGASEEAVAELARSFDLRQYSGIELCREGSDADRLWVLGSGHVSVIRTLSTGRPCDVARLSGTTLVGFSGLVGCPSALPHSKRMAQSRSSKSAQRMLSRCESNGSRPHPLSTSPDFCWADKWPRRIPTSSSPSTSAWPSPV